jgi:hypothetical protein
VGCELYGLEDDLEVVDLGERNSSILLLGFGWVGNFVGDVELEG